MEIKAFLVSGCGVSMVCYDVKAVMGWVEMILDRGGVPEVKEIRGGLVNSELIGG